MKWNKSILIPLCKKVKTHTHKKKTKRRKNDYGQKRERISRENFDPKYHRRDKH